MLTRRRSAEAESFDNPESVPPDGDDVQHDDVTRVGDRAAALAELRRVIEEDEKTPVTSDAEVIAELRRSFYDDLVEPLPTSEDRPRSTIRPRAYDPAEDELEDADFDREVVTINVDSVLPLPVPPVIVMAQAPVVASAPASWSKSRIVALVITTVAAAAAFVLLRT